MKLKTEKQGLCANVIIDGKIMKKNLNNVGKDEDWLDRSLRLKGYKNFSNILLATVDNNEKLIVYERNEDITEFNVLE